MDLVGKMLAGRYEILEEIKRREEYLIRNCKKEVLDIHESKKIISKYYNN